jgi:hypothetical protein
MKNRIIKSFKFKGKLKKNNYFEGWYYKFVNQDQSATLAFIPGISLNKENPHAFIQVILNQDKKIITEYLSYEISEFDYDFKLSKLKIGDNIFYYDRILIDINQDKLHIFGELKLSNLTPINTGLLRPSIMGFFEYLPFMECNHDVVSMNHDLSGTMSFNGKNIDFSKGKGYIEKDYGKSFPEEYVWIQSNNFEKIGTSIMVSYATIPYLGLKFKGFIVNLVFRKQEYRFATYNFSRAKVIESSENSVTFEFKKYSYRLLVKAVNFHTVALASPKKGHMTSQIKEGLTGEVDLKFYNKDALVYEAKGKSAGVEIMLKGDLDV